MHLPVDVVDTRGLEEAKERAHLEMEVEEVEAVKEVAETNGNPVSRGKREEKKFFSRTFCREIDNFFPFHFPAYGKSYIFSRFPSHPSGN